MDPSLIPPAMMAAPPLAASAADASAITPVAPPLSSAAPGGVKIKEKKSKSKKHKKHHKHDRQPASEAGADDATGADDGTAGVGAAAPGLKIRIRVGSGEEGAAGGGGGHKKKKKKKEKKKDKEKKHRHHHKEKRKREQELAAAGIAPPLAPVAPAGTPATVISATTEGSSSLQPPVAKRPHISSGPEAAGGVVPVPITVTPIVPSLFKPNGNSAATPSTATSAPITPSGAASTPLAPAGASAAPAASAAVPVTAAAVPDEPQRPPLQRLLHFLLPLLQKSDPDQFFANPVTDKVAPGYSQIIRQPMDFSTMKTKLSGGLYLTMAAFRADFEVMCTNAMTYNTQDTVYYKVAKKLLQFGKKMMSRERMVLLRDEMPFMKSLTVAEIGFDIMSDPSEDDDDDDDDDEDEDDTKDVSKVIADIRGIVRRPPGRFEAIPDDLSSQEILEQARKAASSAASKLKLYRPKSGMGFLRQKSDGTTSLSFLAGGDGIVPGTDRDRPVSLGNLIGKVKQGTGAITGFREDRRNVAKSVYPLYYGAFSSHGPTFDSTFANLTKEETDAVYSTYGDEVGVQYAESIMNFSRSCDFAMFLVDKLLDVLTGYEHRKTSKYIEEQKLLRSEEQALKGEMSDGGGKNAEEKIDFNSLKSLSDDGIDMSFLDTMQADYEKQQQQQQQQEQQRQVKSGGGTGEDPAQLLDLASQLLQQLQQVQHERLSRAPPQHFSMISRPGEKELELADKIQQTLINIAKNLPPSEVVDPYCVARLLGLPSTVKKGGEPMQTAPAAVSAAAMNVVAAASAVAQEVISPPVITPSNSMTAQQTEPDSQAAHL